MIFSFSDSERSPEKQTDRDREKTKGKKKQDGREIESWQRGGLITQRGARGEIDERKEQRALARESIVGEKDSLFPLQTEKSTEGRKEGADEKDLFFSWVKEKKIPPAVAALLFILQLICSRNIPNSLWIRDSETKVSDCSDSEGIW